MSLCVHKAHSCNTDKSNMLTDEVCVWGLGTMCCYCCVYSSRCVNILSCADAYAHACISERMHARLQYMCMCLCACAFTCVSRGVWGGSSGASSVSVPSATPLCWHPREWQKGWRIHFGKKESGSSGLMGNNVGFTDGKMQRTPAGRVEANLPISLTKQLATPVKNLLSLPNKARTPLKWCCKWRRGTLSFTHTHHTYTRG